MNLLDSVLSNNLKWNILLDPQLDNRDYVSFGRVNKQCFALTSDKEILKKLFPFESLIPKEIDLRKFVFDFTIFSEDEILPKIKQIVSQLMPYQSVDIQASFVSSSYSPFMMKLINGKVFEMGRNITNEDTIKLISALTFNSLSITQFIESMTYVDTLNPAFRYRIREDDLNHHYECITMQFFFRSALKPQNYSINLKEELHKIGRIHGGIVDSTDTIITFKTQDTLKLDYFNLNFTPHVFLSEDDLIELESGVVKLCVIFLEELTGLELKDVNSIEELNFCCIDLNKDIDTLSSFLIFDIDFLANVINIPAIEEIVIKLTNRLSSIGVVMDAFEQRYSQVALSNQCKDLLEFSLKQVKIKEPRNLEKPLFGAFIFVCVLGFLASTDSGAEG